MNRGASTALLLLLGAAAVGTALAVAGGGGGLGGGKLVDVRDAARNARYKKSGNLKRSPKRKMSDVTGITLHQVAVGDPGQPGRFVGRSAYKKMTAHLAVHHDGTVYWIHPFDTRLFASNGLNRETIAIEVAGLFGKNSVVPPAQAAGILRAIAFARQQGNKEGGNVTKIWAHRQSWDKRGGDPGRGIWKAAAIPSGLERPVFSTRGSGLRIPESWDPRAAVSDAGPLDAGTFDAGAPDEDDWPDWSELDAEDLEDMA